MTNNPSLNDGYLVIVSTDVRLIKRGIVNNAIIVYIDLASTIEAFVKWDIEVVGDGFLAILFWLFCVGFWSLLPRGFALWRHLEYERTVIWKNVVVRIMHKKKEKTVHQERKSMGRALAVRRSLVLMQISALESHSANAPQNPARWQGCRQREAIAQLF